MIIENYFKGIKSKSNMLKIIAEDIEMQANKRLIQNRIKMLDNEHKRLVKKIEMASKNRDMFVENKR